MSLRAILDPLWRKRKLATPPLATFSIIPIACPCTKGKALQRKQNLLPREKLRNVRSLPVIQSSPLPQPAGSPSVRYPDGMDHLEVLREKIARLRSEIAQIQESNQEYRLRERVGTEAQVAHGERQERLVAIQRELAQVADLGRRIHSVDKMREMTRARLHPVKRAQAS